jgi:prevent-host-death family protein
MTKQYSVAEARKLLPKLLHDVEGGQPIEITRRGSAVAVVLSLTDYERLAGSAAGFADAYATWRHKVDDADLELPDDYFDGLRDRSPGREVDL